MSEITDRGTADAATLLFNVQIGQDDDVFGVTDFNLVFDSDKYNFLTASVILHQKPMG